MNTTSLETSKLLKLAGFPLTTDHVYLEWKHKTGMRNAFVKRSTPTKIGQEFPAPLAEEILEKLPARVQFKHKVKKTPAWDIVFIPDDELEELKHAGFLQIIRPNYWHVHYISNVCFGDQNMIGHDNCGDNLAEAAAKMYLYLAEHNLLTKEGKVKDK